MKKLLVVGGTGFIGFHVIKEAKKEMENYKHLFKQTKKQKIS